jgi:hypothetical protein
MTTTTTSLCSTDTAATRTTHWGTSAAAAAYVAAWLVGLALAPAAPAPDAPVDAISRFYVDNAAPVLASSALVHGAAGLALGSFAWTLAKAVQARGGLRRAVLGTGITASALSLTQVGIAVAATKYADSDAGRAANLFHALNLVDVLKIALLASFVVAGTTAAAQHQHLPRWLRGLAGVLVPTLVTGSAALVTPAAPLSAALAGSLVGLLVWTGSIAVVLRRAR